MSGHFIPLKYLASEVKSPNVDLSETNLLSLSYGRIVRKDINSNEGLLPNSFSAYNVIEPGDTVLRLTDLQNDQRSLRSGYVPERGIITNAYLTLRPGPRVDPRFFAYWLHGLDTSKRLYALGGGLRQSVGFEDLAVLAVPVPPLDEQRRIADFLDHQVNRIEHVADARRRQSNLIMSELVSGLNEIMWKDTNATIPVRFLISDVTSGPRGWGDLVGDEGERAFLRIANLPRVGIDPVLEDLVRVSPGDTAESRRAMVAAGDVLVGITASIGDVAYVDDVMEGSAFSQHVARLRPLPGVSGEWLAWALQSHRVRDRLTTSAYGGTKMGLGLAEVTATTVPLMDSESRRRTSIDCRRLLNLTFSATHDLRTSAALLTEYKLSLITAAVSGEFDVTSASGRRVA